MKNKLVRCLKVLSSDYEEYGGGVKRWSDPSLSYPDCSSGCRHFVPLEGELGMDWGVCSNPDGPRSGMLTWEHQAGFGCFEQDDEIAKSDPEC